MKLVRASDGISLNLFNSMKKPAKPVSPRSTIKAREGKTWTEKMNDPSKEAVVKKNR